MRPFDIFIRIRLIAVAFNFHEHEVGGAGEILEANRGAFQIEIGLRGNTRFILLEQDVAPIGDATGAERKRRERDYSRMPKMNDEPEKGMESGLVLHGNQPTKGVRVCNKNDGVEH